MATTRSRLESKLLGSFGDHFPHPCTPQDDEVYGPEVVGRDYPRTVLELRMCALSAAIRDKPGWHEKFKDPVIRAKWKAEIIEGEKDVESERALTENMVW
jgi:hypothetical protein